MFLVEKQSGWHLLREDSSGNTKIAESGCQMQSVVEAVAEQQSRQTFRELHIRLSDESFLSTTFNIKDTGGSKKFESLLYRLEADMPRSAEQLAADFMIHKSGRVFGLAADFEQIENLVLGLQSLGLDVRGIESQSIANLEQVLAKFDLPSSCIVVLVSHGKFNVFELEHAAVARWTMTRSAEAAARQVRVTALDTLGDQAAVHVYESDNQSNDWATLLNSVPAVHRLDWEELEQLSLSGRAKKDLSCLDMTRDQRIRRITGDTAASKWIQVVGVTAICLLVVAGICWWKTYDLQAEVASVRAKQIDLFKELFPDQRAPAAVLKRLKSEQAKVRASRSTESSDLPAIGSALPVLGLLLSALPSDVKLAVESVSVSGEDVSLSLDLEQHGHAGAIAKALGETGLVLEPPTTTQTSDGRVLAQFRGDISHKQSSGREP